MKKNELIELLHKINDDLKMQDQLLEQLNQKLVKNIEGQGINMYRPNFKVFNDRVKPLFDEPVNIFSRGIVGPGTVPANASLAGKVYSVQTNDLSVTGDYYVAYYLENPSDSVVTAQIACVFAYVKAKVESNMYKNVSSFTKTGDLTPRNNNSAFSDSSALTVQIASNVASLPLSGGTALYYCAHDTSFVYDFNGVISIPPGHNCVICYQNTGGPSTDSHFNIRWWEIPT